MNPNKLNDTWWAIRLRVISYQAIYIANMSKKIQASARQRDGEQMNDRQRKRQREKDILRFHFIVLFFGFLSCTGSQRVSIFVRLIVFAIRIITQFEFGL